MRLIELKGYRQDPLYQIVSLDSVNSIEDLEDELAKHGYQRLVVGAGAHALVFARENDPYVVKLFMKDLAYNYFMNLVRRNPGNPHFPKFKGKTISFKAGSSKWNLLRMERLRKYNRSNPEDFKIFTVFKRFMGMRPMISFDESIEQVEERVNQQFPEFKATCQLVVDNRYQNSLDIHSGNLMFRGKTPVIIDPYI